MQSVHIGWAGGEWCGEWWVGGGIVFFVNPQVQRLPYTGREENFASLVNTKFSFSFIASSEHLLV